MLCASIWKCCDHCCSGYCDHCCSGCEIETENNDKGKEVVPPSEAVPTPSEDDMLPEEPPSGNAATTATTMRRVGQHTSARSSLPRSWSAFQCPYTSPRTSWPCRQSSSSRPTPTAHGGSP